MIDQALTLLINPYIIGFFILYIFYTILVRTKVIVVKTRDQGITHMILLAFWHITLVILVLYLVAYGIYKLFQLLLYIATGNKLK